MGGGASCFAGGNPVAVAGAIAGDSDTALAFGATELDYLISNPVVWLAGLAGVADPLVVDP